MATQKQIEATYDYMDDVFRLSLGDHADISAAMYDGDFSLTLEQAQKKKHDFILDSLHIKRGDRVLEVGCGWGPMLNAIRERGAIGLGLTLSPAQAAACQADGLNAILKDFKELDPNESVFDAVVAVGPLEHFCSIEEFKAGKQDQIYDAFFKKCSQMLKPGGRLYVQTMLWGKRVPKPEEFDVNARKLSDNWVMGHLEKYYPGSWLPSGLEQLQKCADPYFAFISENNGRLDYIETLKEWGRKTLKFSFKKLWLVLKLLPKYIFDKNFRYQIVSFWYSCNQLVFEREIFTHQRTVFEKNNLGY
jgi:cyclopropane-fatty-acyl-phospholipid synthase